MDADVLVIGASPAGMAAAEKAAKAGAKVILIDRKEDLNQSHPANTFFKFMMDRAGERIEKGYVLHELSGMKIISPGGRCVEIKTPGYFIDRPAFDAYHLSRFASLGGEVLLGTEAAGIKRDGNRMLAKTSSGVISSNVVIAADGIESAMAAKMGLAGMRYPQDIAWAVEADVEAPGIGDAEMFEYYVGNHSPGWKSTYSPRGGDYASLGVYVRRHGRDVSAFFDMWVSHFEKLKGTGLKILRRHVCGDPIATVPDQMIADGLMVTGGAAGQSGIAYGMLAGKICGEVAAKAALSGDTSYRALSGYPRRWQAELGQEYRMGRLSLELLRKMSDPEIDTMTGMFEGEDLSFIRGGPLERMLRTSLFMLSKKPSSQFILLSAMLRR
ncbi:MAG TPA: NAD(P)/FAD-dependent oxidoreductase [Candidatus Methanoperedenaceae archaeon]|nr:NAD(P)/FAD-dependent oxidoreductase [Candidatus Methanoperedenaceae archaeon]